MTSTAYFFFFFFFNDTATTEIYTLSLHDALPISIQVNTGVIGREYPPFSVTLERGKIKEFARAIGDLNPFYVDDRVGAASEWGDIIAPPTCAVTFRDERAGSGALLRELGVDIARALHGDL